MARALAAIGIVLFVFGTIAPGLEAAMGCAEACPDDDAQGRCADGLCCSCCMYASPALPASPEDSPPLLGCSSPPPPEGTARCAEGDGPLHVPKAIRS